MGNSQTTTTTTTTTPDEFASSDVPSSKIRRGSRVKVFGRFGQKKTPTAAAATTTLTTSTKEINTISDDIVADVMLLQQSHAAVIHQLEEEQIDFRKKQQSKRSAKRKKSKFFCRRNEHDDDDDDNEVAQLEEEKKKSLSVAVTKQKRLAPKPPQKTSAIKEETKLTHKTSASSSSLQITTPQIAKTTTIAASTTAENKTIFTPDHREFIEKLFDSVSIVNAPVTVPSISSSDEASEELKSNSRGEGCCGDKQTIKSTMKMEETMTAATTTTTSVASTTLTKKETAQRVNFQKNITTTTPNDHQLILERVETDKVRIETPPLSRSRRESSKPAALLMTTGNVKSGADGAETSERLVNNKSATGVEENVRHKEHDDIEDGSDAIRYCINAVNTSYSDDVDDDDDAEDDGNHIDSAGDNEGDSKAITTRQDLHNYELMAVKEIMSSTDSLFTEPSSLPHVSEAGGDKIGSGEDDDERHVTAEYITPFDKSATAATTSEEKGKQRRPLSYISANSGDTSGILSPLTARAALELQRRHRCDKLAQLSVSQTCFLSLPTGEVSSTASTTEPSPDLEIESDCVDEQMALQLGKKLAQVLNSSGGGGGGGAGAGAGNTDGSSGVTTAPQTMSSSDIFNISKAKKVELQNLSSRILSPANASESAAFTSTVSADATKLPLSSAETQSTVIISFKPTTSSTSSTSTSLASATMQTPVQSQPLMGQHNAMELSDGMEVTAPPPPTTTPPPSAYAICSPCSNVLMKVASFTVEKSSAATMAAAAAPSTPTTATSVPSMTTPAAASGAAAMANGSGSVGITTHNMTDTVGLKRLSYVPEKLSFAAYEKFEGQMLMKWFTSSLQRGLVTDQDLNSLTMQYCNNLINVGVLKQISEKNDLETFSPFHMYQWTHKEAPTTSLPLTPGKLDKFTAWPHCSTPTSTKRIPKATQVDTPTTANGSYHLLRKRLSACNSMAEVQAVVHDITLEIQRRHSKRTIHLPELLNSSETTIYAHENNAPVLGVGDSRTATTEEAAVQTDALPNSECAACAQKAQNSGSNDKVKCDRGIQTTPVRSKPPEDAKIAAAAIEAASPPAPTPPPPPPPPLPSLGAKGLSSLPQPPPPPPPLPLPIQVTGPPPPPPPPPLAPLTASGGPPPPPPPPQMATSAPVLVAAPSASSPPPPPPPALHLNTSSTSSAGGTPKTGSSTPAPLPNPTECGWFDQSNKLRKNAVNPPRPMKPLYWTRIVTNKPAAACPVAAPTELPGIQDTAAETTQHVTSTVDPAGVQTANTAPKEIWQEIDETKLDNIDEFTELFSRQAVVPIVKPKEKKELRVKTMKVLDSKRSQNVGIVSRSLHVDFYEIEHAIYHVDTSVVSLETLQQIINIKATSEELELIKEAALGDIPLDHPEQFLLKISQISMSTERISCIVFQAEFEESATLITRKLEVVMQLSQYLIESDDLKLLFSIILTLGNYMNGGNRQRGQADGFTLEILGKLKDVKSKESNTTLLHFIVRTYINRRRKEGLQILEIPLPIPEPSDVERAAQVDFDEVKMQVAELHKKLNVCKKTTEKVVMVSIEDTLEPFKSKMEEFIETATKTIERLYKELDECRDLFLDTMRFYHFTPKSRTLEQCTPDQFFEYWTNFTNDFKDIWKKEINTIWNELLKKSKQIQMQTRTNVKTTKLKPGGLKERIMRLSKK